MGDCCILLSLCTVRLQSRNQPSQTSSSQVFTAIFGQTKPSLYSGRNHYSRWHVWQSMGLSVEETGVRNRGSIPYGAYTRESKRSHREMEKPMVDSVRLTEWPGSLNSPPPSLAVFSCLGIIKRNTENVLISGQKLQKCIIFRRQLNTHLLKLVIAAWLNASHRSRHGFGMNRSARG